AEFAVLLARWEARQSRRTGSGPTTTPAKPSLLDAILTEDPLLDGVAFSWYSFGAELTDSEVEKAARSKGIPLPKQSDDWTWLEDSAKPGLLKLLKKECRNKPHISWRVKLDEKDNIEKFMSQDSFAAPFIDGFCLNGFLVSIRGTYPTWTPFDLTAR